MHTMLRGALLLLSLCSFALPVQAQELHQENQGVARAEVVSVVKEEYQYNGAADADMLIQTLEARILSGEEEGKIITLRNDYVPLAEGNRFFVNRIVTIDGLESYSVREVDRAPVLFLFIGLFVLIILLFGGKQGVRSLLSLAASFVAIIYVLLPLLLKGYPPVPVSVAIATLILAIAIFLTHGFNRRSLIAFAGTVTAVLITGIIAHAAITWGRLTGFASDESVYLTFVTSGAINVVGLLLGGILIGALGVLDDISITQVAVVSELYHAVPEMKPSQAYRKAIRVGKEHVGALVNTLALAYAGASLPLLLLFLSSDLPFSLAFSNEVFATEMVRIIAGSIGLVLAVPLTTFMAAYFLKGHGEAAPGHAHPHF